jgi:hypothetical protein
VKIVKVPEFLTIASTAITIIAALVSAALFIWIYRGFMPVLDVRIIPRWVDEAAGVLIIRLEVENRWKIGVKKKLARFQILEHRIPEGGLLSEWVPFAKDRILDSEPPIVWRNPREVLTSTVKIESKETITVELLYRSPNHVALHCAFQFIANLNPIASLAYRLGSGTDSWTRTIWVTPPGKSAHSPVKEKNPGTSPDIT